MNTVAPAVSIVVADDGRNLEAVLESLEAQRRDSLEVIVSKGRDFGDAVERGVASARAAIIGCFDAADRLQPGAVEGIARTLAPGRGRFVAMGRAAWLLDDLDNVAVAHPSEYLGIGSHLRIWRTGFNTVPRASFFWHRSVRERVGGFMRGPSHVVDYDFTCRVGMRFEIERVDALWSASRLPGKSSGDPTDHEILQECIAVSRAHWGPWWSPLRWSCALSFAAYQHQWHDHARHHARRRERALAEGRSSTAALELARTWMYSPSMARGRFLER